jgi:hypothetical protein
VDFNAAFYPILVPNFMDVFSIVATQFLTHVLIIFQKNKNKNKKNKKNKGLHVAIT